MSLFHNAGFSILVVAGTVANIAYAVTIYLSTVNLQQVRGLDPLMAGLTFLGPSVGAAPGGPCRDGWRPRSRRRSSWGLGVLPPASLAALGVSGGWVAY